MFLRLLKYLILTVLILILVLLAIVFMPSLWRRWAVYPKLEKKVTGFQQLRRETAGYPGLHVYEGHFHLHSYWSHDSEGRLPDIIPAALRNNVEFIFLSDHPRNSQDTFPRGYQGYYNGVLIEPGSERKGLNVWPLQPAIIDWRLDADTIVKTIADMGGIAVYSHTEEPHNWDNPWYHGMEIYNFHTDTKDETYSRVIPDFIVNGKKYRHWAYRQIFDEQTAILELWDRINTKRKVVGFSAIDTHENQNFRARYLPDGRVQWLGPNAKPIDTVEVNLWNRWLFSPPDTSGWIFKLMIDTYDTGFGYVSNYLLSDTLSVSAIAESFRKGHLYTAFKSLGDARGFMFHTKDSTGAINAIMGDSIMKAEVSSLHAVSPFPGEFRLIHNGKTVDVSGIQYEYRWDGPFENGVWRIEMHVNATGKMTPWLYANPVYIY